MQSELILSDLKRKSFTKYFFDSPVKSLGVFGVVLSSGGMYSVSLSRYRFLYFFFLIFFLAACQPQKLKISTSFFHDSLPGPRYNLIDPIGSLSSQAHSETRANFIALDRFPKFFSFSGGCQGDIEMCSSWSVVSVDRAVSLMVTAC